MSPSASTLASRIRVIDTAAGDLSALAAAFRAAAGPSSRVEVTKGSWAPLGPDSPDLVVVDYLLGDGAKRGPELIARIRSDLGDIPVVAVAEHGDVKLAAEAIAAGAADFLVRGGDLEERVATLLRKVRKLLDLRERNRALDEQNRLLNETYGLRLRIVGESPQTLEVLRRIRKVASIPRPVLILGERGTGKELVARAIHTASDRASRPFVVVNCAAFPDTLLESELFGHEKGAFTGAESARRGKFEVADGGTLFLDEISHMSLPFQQKILRAVEYGTFTRVGGMDEVESSARIVAATNADLRAMISEGRFLADLHDRLAFEEIRVPPLREREGDVEILARHFLEEFGREIPSLGRKRLGATALERLRNYSFPGNVRELKNVIERAAYREGAEEIGPEDLGLLEEERGGAPRAGFEEEVEGFRRRLIIEALRDASGNQAAAARRLGLTYHQYRYYLRKYGGKD